MGRAYTTTGIAVNFGGTQVPSAGEDLRLYGNSSNTVAEVRFDVTENQFYTRILNIGGTAGGGTELGNLNLYTGTTRTMSVSDNGLIMKDGNYLSIEGTHTPSAPSVTNGCRLYLDTSGGKTRLMALFESGAAQIVATEP